MTTTMTTTTTTAAITHDPSTWPEHQANALTGPFLIAYKQIVLVEGFQANNRPGFDNNARIATLKLMIETAEWERENAKAASAAADVRATDAANTWKDATALKEQLAEQTREIARLTPGQSEAQTHIDRLDGILVHYLSDALSKKTETEAVLEKAQAWESTVAALLDDRLKPRVARIDDWMAEQAGW